MKRRLPQRRDHSEAAIIKALRDAGCDVEQGNDCDLYVKRSYGAPLIGETNRYSRAFMLECKTPGPNAKRRQPLQERLQAIFGPEQYKVVSSPQEALQAVGLG